MNRFSVILVALIALTMSLVTIPLKAVATCLCPGCSWKAIVLSDLHINDGNPERLERVSHVVNDINAGKYNTVHFVVITGDAVATIFNGNGTQNVEPLITTLGQLGTVPYYIALGNHDYRWNSSVDSEGLQPFWVIYWGEWFWSAYGIPAYQSFDYNGCWKFIILNSDRGKYLSASKHINDQDYYGEGNELVWLSSELDKANQNGERVTIFMHHPLKTDHFNSTWGSDLITSSTDPGFYQLLNNYQNIIKHIFVGHGHHFQMDTLYGKIGVRETDSLGESSTDVCRYPKYRAKADFDSNDHKPNCD
jgi:hypothetical protein